MVYDVFIFSLTVLGIVTALVYSHKIAHSRVYPVGMVRKMPAASPAQERVDEITVHLPDSLLQGDIIELVAKGLSNSDIAKDLHISESEVKRCIHRLALGASVKKKAANWQIFADKEFGTFQPRLRQPLLHAERLTLEAEVTEQSEILEHHLNLFADLEKRVRRLEVEKVRMSQEAAAEEKPHPPQAEVIVH